MSHVVSSVVDKDAFMRARTYIHIIRKYINIVHYAISGVERVFVRPWPQSWVGGWVIICMYVNF